MGGFPQLVKTPWGDIGNCGHLGLFSTPPFPLRGEGPPKGGPLDCPWGRFYQAQETSLGGDPRGSRTDTT